MLPVAFGTILFDGTVSAGSANIQTVVVSGTGRYDITFNGLAFDQANFVALATSRGNNYGAMATQSGSDLRIQIFDTTDQMGISGGFFFAVWKP